MFEGRPRRHNMRKKIKIVKKKLFVTGRLQFVIHGDEILSGATVATRRSTDTS